MNRDSVARALKPLAIAVVVTVPSVLMLGVIVGTGRQKLLGAALGAIALAILAFVLGNVRLLCLWGLALTLPLSLAKRFGMILFKGGGENTFAIEVSDAFLGVLLLFVLRDAAVGARKTLRFPRINAIPIIIMLMGLIVMVFGDFQRPPAHEIVRMTKVMLLFVVLCNELRRPKQMLQVAGALTIGVIANSVIGLVQYWKKGSLGLQMLGEANPETIDILAVTSVEGARLFRISALLLHPNIFGVYLAALLPLAIGCFLVVQRWRYKIIFLTAIVLGMVALIGTHSRSGWVSFAGSFAVLMFLLIRSTALRRRSIAALLVAVAALFLVTGAFHEKILTRLFRSKAEATTAREMWKDDARRMLAARPVFGHGLNNYVHALPPYMTVSQKFYGDPPWLPPVHNIYYLVLAELGLFGFGLHVLMWGSIILTGIRNLAVRDEVVYTISAACLASMAAFAIDGNFSFTLRIGNMLRVFWMLSGIIYAIRYWHLQQISTAPEAAEAPQPEFSSGMSPVPA